MRLHQAGLSSFLGSAILRFEQGVTQKEALQFGELGRRCVAPRNPEDPLEFLLKKTPNCVCKVILRWYSGAQGLGFCLGGAVASPVGGAASPASPMDPEPMRGAGTPGAERSGQGRAGFGGHGEEGREAHAGCHRRRRALRCGDQSHSPSAVRRRLQRWRTTLEVTLTTSELPRLRELSQTPEGVPAPSPSEPPKESYYF